MTAAEAAESRRSREVEKGITFLSESAKQDCVENAERYILRAAAAVSAGVPDKEIRKRLEAEGCDPDQVSLLIVAGKQLSRQQEEGFFGASEGGGGFYSWRVDYLDLAGTVQSVTVVADSKERAFEAARARVDDWKMKVTAHRMQPVGGAAEGGEKEEGGFFGAGAREMKNERRAHVQGDGLYNLRSDDPRRKGAHYPGSIAWQEHEEAWTGYAKRFPGSARDQDAKRVAQRGGFSYNELVEYLGHAPTTWIVSPQFASGAQEDPYEKEEECRVCQPFTSLVRDPSKLKACMAIAEPLGDLKDARKLYELTKGDLQRQDQEVFVVVCLDFRGKLRDYAEVARGQRHRVAVDIEDITRIVVASARDAGCDGYAVLHCHPTGVAEASEADGQLTDAIRKATEVSLPSVHFLDHIVVGLGEFYSFAMNDWKDDGKVVKVT